MIQTAEAPAWSRRRWIVTIAIIVAGQIALVLYFGERPHNMVRAIRSQTSLHLAIDEWSARQIAEWPTLDDPTLFALPSRHGFSGKAWMTFPLLQYQMKDWTEPPAYLAFDRSQLGKTPLASFTYTSEMPPVEIFASAAPNLLTMPLTVPPVTVRSTSELRVEGELQERRFIDRPQLPSWPYDDLLSNTVVQLLVNQQGEPISTTLLRSSNSKEADDFALKCAAGARFEPLRNRGAAQAGPKSYSSGRLIFQWHTVPRPETNSLSGQP